MYDDGQPAEEEAGRRADIPRLITHSCLDLATMNSPGHGEEWSREQHVQSQARPKVCEPGEMRVEPTVAEEPPQIKD